MDGKKLLRIYMNDHLASATAASEVAKRMAASNLSSELGRFLDRCVVEFKEEAQHLEETISASGLPVGHHKKAAGWLGEKAGRLKLNGRLIGYSPLSRIVELEGLLLLNEANLSLWHRLRDDIGGPFDAGPLDRFIDRGMERRDSLSAYLSEASKVAFGSEPDAG